MAGTEGIPGSIQISYELIKDGFVCEPRGPIEVKGKATMQTYLLLSRRDAATWTDRGRGAAAATSSDQSGAAGAA